MTARERLYPEIRRLREDEGLMWREIGERLGLARSTVHDYYSDPTGAAAAARKAASDVRTRGTCPRCGGPTGPRRIAVERCRSCWRSDEAVARACRVEDVAEMFREGMSYRDIARELGYGESSQAPEITEARRRGLIGYRNNGYGQVAA